MPLSIDTNLSQSKTHIMTSDIVEIIALINILADDKHHEYAQQISKGIYSGLTTESKDFLKYIYYLPFQGLEFYELIIASRIFNNINILIEEFLSYSNDKFVFILTGEQISLEDVIIFKEDKQKFNTFLEEAPWLVKENSFIFQEIMYNTDKFKQSLAKLLKEVNNNMPTDKLVHLQSEYQTYAEQLRMKLLKHSPIELLQQLMNKKIDTDPEVKEYIFIPSYFIKPHYLMGFNKESRLCVYDMRLSTPFNSEQSELITEILKVISDKTRLEILRLIILQPSYGKLLADRLNLSTPTISHHLDLLLSQGLIIEQKSKNIKYFSANVDEIERVIIELRNYLFNN